MDRTLCIATIWLCFVAHCSGVELTFNPGPLNTCGILTCKEDINVMGSSTSGKDQDGSRISFKRVLSLSLIKMASNNAEGQRDSILATVSSQTSRIKKDSDGMKVVGLLEPGRASLTVELLKVEDCKANFVCRVLGVDKQERKAVSSLKLVQQNDQKVNSASLAQTAPLQMLNLIKQFISGLENRVGDKLMSIESRIEDKLESTINTIEELRKDLISRSRAFENRIEDRVRELQRYLTTRSDSFKDHIYQKLDWFENRIEDKIDSSKNDRYKPVQINTQIQKQLVESIDGMIERFQKEQRQFMENICQQSEQPINRTAPPLLNLVNEASDSPISNGQADAVTKSEEQSVVVTEKQTCYKGMKNSLDQTNERYVEMAYDSIHKDILCDTETDGGGWIVIQIFIVTGLTTRTVNGFGNLRGDFWLGNDAIHNLTSKEDCELRIDLVIDNEDFYAKYRLEVGDHSGTLDVLDTANALSRYNGQGFSTHDRDNDRSSDNLAVKYHGAWWYGTKKFNWINLN
ncbi:ficolin-1, partial [Elysia marginata]